MKKLVLFLSILFVSILTGSLAFATSNFTPDEMDFIDRFILFLENIDLDGIHATLTAIVGLLLIILNMFKRKIKRLSK